MHIGFLLSVHLKKIISDNGGEFDNYEVRQLGEIFNIQILTKASEILGNNEECEMFNRVLGGVVEKIILDNNCTLKSPSYRQLLL